jgi:aminomethyltransferase
MTVIELHGTDALPYLNRLLANDIGPRRLFGKAMYSAMLNETGGILDDLMVYATGDSYLVVGNCSTRAKDLAWMKKTAEPYDCQVLERPELAILAIQGPKALEKVKSVAGKDRATFIDSLKNFRSGWCSGWFISRTGYTGEKGVEIILEQKKSESLWDQLLSAGIRPVGLGARDTLRLEAGMNLYGNDMDESVTPFEANMTGTVKLKDRNFIGADFLRIQAGHDELVGLVMVGSGILRAEYPVYSEGVLVGKITSGAFSPTLKTSIALARVSRTSLDMAVKIRGKLQEVECVAPPFVRDGKQAFKSR